MILNFYKNSGIINQPAEQQIITTSEIGEQVIQKAFEINSNNIYGFMLALLILALIAALYAVWYLVKSDRTTMRKVIEKNTLAFTQVNETLKDKKGTDDKLLLLTTKLELFLDGQKERKIEMKECIRSALREFQETKKTS